MDFAKIASERPDEGSMRWDVFFHAPCQLADRRGGTRTRRARKPLLFRYRGDRSAPEHVSPEARAHDDEDERHPDERAERASLRLRVGRSRIVVRHRSGRHRLLQLLIHRRRQAGILRAEDRSLPRWEGPRRWRVPRSLLRRLRWWGCAGSWPELARRNEA